MNKPHTDIQIKTLIAKLPDPVQPYAYLARLDRPIGWWLLLLPGLWAIVLAAGGVMRMNIVDWQLALLFFIGAVIMRAAGCVINDLWDRNLDQKVERTQARPIAAGVIGVKPAFAFLFGLLFAGCWILLQMNIVTILLGVLSIPLIILYPLMKRWTWWPQIFLGIVFNFGALMGWAAVTGVLQAPALMLYVAGILWTIGYDTIYAHQDKEDDLLVGIKSSALKLGEKSQKWVAGLYGASAFLIVWAGGLAGAGFAFHVVMAFAIMHMYRQVKDWDLSDPASSLNAFKSNRDFGLIVLAAMCFSGI